MKRSMAVGALVLSLTASLGALAAPASAHRDGCHRWHSCPSDTGSYTCGDLGYFSECLGAEPDILPRRKRDVTAPHRPTVAFGKPGVRGLVTATITAERGAKVTVREGKKVVARAVGAGHAVRVTFRAATGTHRYTVLATDSAGNVSAATEPTSVRAYASAPRIDAVSIAEPDPHQEATEISFETSTDASYSVTVKGRSESAHGKAVAGSNVIRLWLPDGTFTVRIAVRDVAGNERVVERKVSVHIAKPFLSTRLMSEEDSTDVTFAIQAPARSKGVLAIPGVPATPFTVGEDGSAFVETALADGVYSGMVTLTDFVGRRATSAIEPFTVDTRPPSLSLDVDSAAARKGRLAVSVSAEAGAGVDLMAVRQGAGAVSERAASSVHSSGQVIRWSPDVQPGVVLVSAVATDAAGNSTRRELRVGIQDPLTALEVVQRTALGLLVIGILVIGGLLIRRHRAAIRSAWIRAVQRGQERRYERALAQWRDAELRYEQRRDEIIRLLHIAENENGVEGARVGINLKRNERVYLQCPVMMVEDRLKEGAVTRVPTATGTLVLTDRRAVFCGAKNREWSFGERLTRYWHDEQDTTMFQVRDRKGISGVRFHADAETSRLRLDIAIADQAGGRHAVIETVRALASAHDAARPRPPLPPPPRRSGEGPSPHPPEGPDEHGSARSSPIPDCDDSGGSAAPAERPQGMMRG